MGATALGRGSTGPASDRTADEEQTKPADETASMGRDDRAADISPVGTTPATTFVEHHSYSNYDARPMAAFPLSRDEYEKGIHGEAREGRAGMASSEGGELGRRGCLLPM